MAQPKYVQAPLSRFIPRRLRLPLRYYYRQLVGPFEAELRELPSIVSGREIAIDVGANIGFYTYAMSRIFRRVEAFEPIAECAQQIAEFGASNVRVHNIALSSSSGVAELHIPVQDGRPTSALASIAQTYDDAITVSVPMRTLDNFGFEGVSFIKIDVEGHELEVLRGAATTIRREQPVMLIEIDQRYLPFPVEDIFTFLADCGLEGHFRYKKEMHSLREFDPAVHQNESLYGDPSVYVNNFIFRPKGK